VVNIASSRDAFAAVHADGSVSVWGNAANGGADPPATVTSPPDGALVVGIASTQTAFAALVIDSIECQGVATATTPTSLADALSPGLCTPPYTKESSLSFGPNGEHKLVCKYEVMPNSEFNMDNTGCRFEMA